MTDIDPKRARIYRDQVAQLQRQNEALQEENYHLKQQLYTHDLPDRVRTWMREYDLPIWEVFYCYEHKKFFTELDTAFPYFMADCVCEDCSNE